MPVQARYENVQGCIGTVTGDKNIKTTLSISEKSNFLVVSRLSTSSNSLRS